MKRLIIIIIIIIICPSAQSSDSDSRNSLTTQTVLRGHLYRHTIKRANITLEYRTMSIARYKFSQYT